MKTALAFTYGDSTYRHIQNNFEVLLRDVDSFNLSDEKESAYDKVSRNTVTVETTEKEDENSAMDVWTDY